MKKDKKIEIVACVLLLGCVALYYTISLRNMGAEPIPSTKKVELVKPKTPIVDTKLELLSWHFYLESGFAVAEGQVKNITSENLKNVEAIVQYYDGADRFVKSADGIVEFNPILPNQTTPFKIVTSGNPEIKTASVSFKFVMGGTIVFKDSRGKIVK